MKRSKWLILLLPIILSGCGESNKNETSAYYFLSTTKNLSDIGRVAFIELANDSAYPKIAADTTDSLYAAVQKKQIFGMTLVRQNDPRWQSLQLDKFSSYSYEQLSQIHKTVKADAILRGTITRYEPYPHLIIGLRLELIDLSNGQLLWALEQIWDAADKSTQDRIRDYYKTAILPMNDSLETGLGVVSSLKFINFVSYETAKTMTPKDK